jgi:hypothetical protein
MLTFGCYRGADAVEFCAGSPERSSALPTIANAAIALQAWLRHAADAVRSGTGLWGKGGNARVGSTPRTRQADGEGLPRLGRNAGRADLK